MVSTPFLILESHSCPETAFTFFFFSFLFFLDAMAACPVVFHVPTHVYMVTSLPSPRPEYLTEVAAEVLVVSDCVSEGKITREWERCGEVK